MGVLLSICIPTYNRSACLRVCLESILQSAEGIQDQIEILISDNDSTDDTNSVASKFSAQYPCIRYDRNSRNLGCERNVYKVVSSTATEYIWIVGDDDKIAPNAIPTILKHLESKYDLIVTDYAIYDKYIAIQKLPSRFNLTDNRVFDDLDELMKVFGIQLGYMSNLIMKKSVFLSTPFPEYEAFADYGFSIMYTVYAGLQPSAQVLYLADPLVHNRADNSGNFDWYKYFVEGTSLTLDALRNKGYSKDAVRAAKHMNIKDYVIRDILVRKRDDRETWGLFSRMYPYYKKNWLFWLGCVPALLLPRFLVKLADRIMFMPRRQKVTGPAAEDAR